MMKTYRALVVNKETKMVETLTDKFLKRQDFIDDLRRNGYRVVDYRVREEKLFNYICDNTDMTKEDWMNYKLDKDGNVYDKRETGKQSYLIVLDNISFIVKTESREKAISIGSTSAKFHKEDLKRIALLDDNDKEVEEILGCAIE